MRKILLVLIHAYRYLFACYRKSDARAVARILTYQKRDAGVAKSNIVLKNLLKICCAR